MEIKINLPKSDNEEYYQLVTFDENGAFKDNPEKTNNEILQKFQSWDDVNTTLWNSMNNGKPPVGVAISSVHNTVEGVFNNIKTLDKFGKAIIQGSPCPVCGKRVKFMPPCGYCSVECAVKDLTQKIFSNKSKGDTPWQKYIDAIQDTLNFLDLVLNVVMELPQKLKDIANLPPEYAKFLTLRINIIFLKIRIMINKLMIYKNEMIIKMLQPITTGVVYDFVALMFGPINQVIMLVQQLRQALNTSYTVALKAMNMPALSLPAGSFAWVATPRSIIRLPNTPLYVTIPADAPPTIPTMSTALNCLNVEGIASTVLKMFPPIAPIEYFMDPKAFDVRLALSDQGDIVKQVMESLEMVMKLSPEYMPRYKNLKITNPWFLMATLIGWAPKALMSFGSIINPFV